MKLTHVILIALVVATIALWAQNHVSAYGSLTA
jgi:hypothetical protein